MAEKCKICGVVVAPKELEDFTLCSATYGFCESGICYWCAKKMNNRYSFANYRTCSDSERAEYYKSLREITNG